MEWLPTALAAVVYVKLFLFVILGIKFLYDKSVKQKIK
jgi:hypothetical protein